MSSSPVENAVPLATRTASYTTPRPDIFDMVPPSAADILDVGCSNGALGRSLKVACPTRNVCGIEFDSAFAKEAAEHLDFVINADLNLLKWDDAMGGRRFDCIIFADVLEHLVDPHQCLLQGCQYLKPGGCVIVSLPNIRHISAFQAIFIGGHFPVRDRGIFDRTHLHWFTVTDAHDLLANSDLKVSTTSLALRWGDCGGGRMNRLLNRLPASVQHWTPVREFLTYQICLRAEAVR